MGYFTIDAPARQGFYDIDYLNSLPAEYESDSIRIVTLSSPLSIGIDGKKGEGVVAKPGYSAPADPSNK